MAAKISKSLVLLGVITTAFAVMVSLQERPWVIANKDVPVFASALDADKDFFDAHVDPFLVLKKGEKARLLSVGYTKNFEYYKVRLNDRSVGYMLSSAGVDIVKL